MADIMCGDAMQLLNAVFGTPIIFNDGHEILARLEAGEPVADIAEDFAAKFGRPTEAAGIRRVLEGWPPLHVEAVERMVQWALGKLDTDDRVMINWKGDADNPETVTRFELRDHTLLVEFAHPPFSVQTAPVGP